MALTAPHVLRLTKTTVFPLKSSFFAYIDTEESVANKVFKNYNLKVKVKECYNITGTNYNVSYCYVKDSDLERFARAMIETRDNILLLGYRNFDEDCMSIRNDYFKIRT